MISLLGDHNQALATELAKELELVGKQFQEELTSDLACVNELVTHADRYRGKMLRPTLVMLSALATKPNQPLTNEHRVLAAVMEMVHMATLVHDDVLDESDVRRRGATINHLQGNEAAVMLGDYMISHAYHLCSSLGSQKAARIVAKSTNVVCEGELLQLSNRNNWELDEAVYFEIIRRKTASLCGASCRLGTIFAGGDDATADAIYNYGEKLGIAFQVIDDVLDLAGDQDVVGKSLRKDIEKGKLTLPMIHWLQTVDESERAERVQWLNVRDEASVAKIGESLASGDSLAYAKQRAEASVQEAKDCLNIFADSPARDVLHQMADAVVTRDF